MQKLGLEAERAVGFVRGGGTGRIPPIPRNSSSSDRQKQKLQNQNRSFTPCGAARSYHSNRSSYGGRFAGLCSGGVVGCGREVRPGIPAGAVSLSQLNVHLTIKETVHGQLCFLFCTYILTAQCLRMQRYYKQQDLVIITSKGSTVQQPRKAVWWWQ